MKLQVLLLFVLLSFINSYCNNHVSATSEKSDDQSSAADQNIQTNVADTSNNPVRFGVMVAKTEGKIIPPSQQVKVAKALGVNYIRARIDIEGWAGSNDACDTYAAAGLKILLNINYGIPRTATGEKDPIPFPTDMVAYSKAVNSILDKYKPEVVVIENEEDNPNYHAGSADDYINELKTGIQIAHAKGLKVTNGGITVREVCLIIYDDYMQHGQQQKAKDFAARVFPDALLQRLNNLHNPQIARQVEFGRKIIAAYKTLDLDYVNFHWYEPVRGRGKMGNDVNDTTLDESIFTSVVNYLKTVTGKPVLTNEFGVFNTSPALVKGILKAAYDAKLSYAIFYSADGGVGKAVALQNAIGELRQNGIAFKDFIKEH